MMGPDTLGRSRSVASLKGWTLLPKFDLPGEGVHSDHAALPDALSTPCPVCQKSHEARLVRRLVISPVASEGERIEAIPRNAPRYYPPAVPILSRRSSGPISLSAHWSLAVA